jgi:hypothetical protein
VPIVEDTQAIPMVIADETGAVPVDAQAAKLDLKSSRRHANLFCGLPKEIEQSLRDRYKIVTTMAWLPKQMRYTETVIAEDVEVFVHGECEVTDGKPEFTTRNQPLYLSFRNEEQLRRNGKITVGITLVAAIAVPILFTLLAVATYWNISSTFGPNNQAGKQNAAKDNAGKDKPGSQEIAKLKNPNSSLSERAWAARGLPERAAADSAADVAPQLNPLLQSDDNFHRESALMAINRGWGTQANESILKALIATTKDAGAKKDLNAALKKLGK